MAPKEDYKALTFLMVGDEKKSPGDSVSLAELEAAGQTPENVKQLLESGALGGQDDEIDPAHQPVEVEAPAGSENHVIAGDAGKGKTGD